MTENTLGLDNRIHELKLGDSFDTHSGVAFHTMRYDFKPASVDTTKECSVDVLEGNQVVVTVPHVEGSATANTVYKGNKRPCTKECVLIIDHQTGTITLEKVRNVIPLKKTRPEGSSKVNQSTRPLTPVDYNRQKHSPAKQKTKQRVTDTPSPTHTSQKVSPIVTPVPMEQEKGAASPIGEISDDSSDSGDESGSDSGSDADNHVQAQPTVSSFVNGHSSNTTVQSETISWTVVKDETPHPRQFSTTLSQDLQLSDSESESDSD